MQGVVSLKLKCAVTWMESEFGPRDHVNFIFFYDNKKYWKHYTTFGF
jgi:hypothetical protein